MMNDVVSDPVGSFVGLAMPPPDINGPLPYQKDASRRLSAACGRLSFFTKRFQSKAGQKHLEGTLT